VDRCSDLARTACASGPTNRNLEFVWQISY
jgi:hypothetical protein